MPFDDPAIGVLVLGGGGGPPSTGDETPPAAPTGLAATPGNTTVSLGWSDNTEADFDRYRVYQATTSGGPYTLIATVTVSEYTATALTNGVTYYFVVTAVDDFGNESVESVEVTGIPVAAPPGDVTPPAVPSGLTATPGDRQVTLNWDNSGDTDFASFKVYRASTQTGTYVLIATRTVSDYVNTGLTNDTTYWYKVSAVDTTGNESAQSGAVPGTPAGVPGDTVAPAVPTGLTATAGDRTVTLNWNNNTEPDLSSYRVYRSLTSGGSYTFIATRTTSDHVDGTLTNGTTYFYKVSAVDTSGNESGQTAFVSATPVAPPPPPPPPGGDGFPTYENRQVTINVGDDFSTVMSAHPAGTLFGVAPGTHNITSAGAQFTLRAGERMVGQTDANGVPTSIIRGNWNETQFGTGLKSPWPQLDSALPTNVHLYRLDFRNFAPELQQSSIGGGSSWRIHKCWIHHIKAGGVRIGSNSIVFGGKIYRCGQLGVVSTNGGNAGVLDGVEVYEHNFWDWNDIAAEGGMKFIGGFPTNYVVRNCHFHNNHGPGIWFDQGGAGGLIEDNLSENNERAGIFYELCSGAGTIRRNLSRFNGGAANIYVASSRGVSGGPIVVEDNVTHNSTGSAEIWLKDDPARTPRTGYVTVRRNRVHRQILGAPNIVCGHFGSTTVPPGIVINENDYFTNITNAWQWLGTSRTWSEWRALGFDTIGTLSGYQAP